MDPGKVFAAYLVSDQCILGGRSMIPGIEIDTPRDSVAASLNGDRCILGWRPMHTGMAIDASQEGITGW